MCTERDKDPPVETFYRFAKNDSAFLMDFKNNPGMITLFDTLHTQKIICIIYLVGTNGSNL